ncbi:unnamed protein product, partial [Prorocentrum cordatum]
RTPRGTILSPTPPLQSTPGPSEWPAARSRPRGWGASAPQPPRRAEENDHAAGNAPGARRYPLCWHGSSGVGARGGREARRPGELERLLQAPSTGSKVKRVVRATSARRPGPRAAGGAGLGRLLRARGLGAGTTQGAGAVAAIGCAKERPRAGVTLRCAVSEGHGRAKSERAGQCWGTPVGSHQMVTPTKGFLRVAERRGAGAAAAGRRRDACDRCRRWPWCRCRRHPPIRKTRGGERKRGAELQVGKSSRRRRRRRTGSGSGSG